MNIEWGWKSRNPLPGPRNTKCELICPRSSWYTTPTSRTAMSLIKRLCAFTFAGSCIVPVLGASVLDSPGDVLLRRETSLFSPNLILENCTDSLPQITTAIDEFELLAKAAYDYPTTGEVWMHLTFYNCTNGNFSIGKPGSGMEQVSHRCTAIRASKVRLVAHGAPLRAAGGISWRCLYWLLKDLYLKLSTWTKVTNKNLRIICDFGAIGYTPVCRLRQTMWVIRLQAPFANLTVFHVLCSCKSCKAWAYIADSVGWADRDKQIAVGHAEERIGLCNGWYSNPTGSLKKLKPPSSNAPSVNLGGYYTRGAGLLHEVSSIPYSWFRFSNESISSDAGTLLITYIDDARGFRKIGQEIGEWGSSIWPWKHIETGERKSSDGEKQCR